MLFSYVVARDYGFAPNPFYGVCTLATCKPKIRGTASRGDWIVGTGSSKNGRQGRLVYVMCVTEVMTFNKYWMDERFEKKNQIYGEAKSRHTVIMFTSERTTPTNGINWTRIIVILAESLISRILKTTLKRTVYSSVRNTHIGAVPGLLSLLISGITTAWISVV